MITHRRSPSWIWCGSSYRWWKRGTGRTTARRTTSTSSRTGPTTVCRKLSCPLLLQFTRRVRNGVSPRFLRVALLGSRAGSSRRGDYNRRESVLPPVVPPVGTPDPRAPRAMTSLMTSPPRIFSRRGIRRGKQISVTCRCRAETTTLGRDPMRNAAKRMACERAPAFQRRPFPPSLGAL